MENENNPGSGLPGGAQLTSSDPRPNVGGEAPSGSQPNVEGLTLTELNALTGRNFPTKDAALKSIQDTFSFVGKRKEDIEREVVTRLGNNDEIKKLSSEMEGLRKDMFYKDNPKYAPYRSLLEKVGGDPAAVVNSAEFKDVFEKASGFDESQKLRTVLESNPRLASSVDKLTKAKEAVSKEGHPSESTEQMVVDAVKDAYNL